MAYCAPLRTCCPENSLVNQTVLSDACSADLRAAAFLEFCFYLLRWPEPSGRLTGWTGYSGLPAGEAAFIFSSYRQVTASARHRSRVASRRGAGGKGLASPLPPTTPNPALGQPSLTGELFPSGLPFSSFRRASYGLRPPAVPRKARDELPDGVGAAAHTGRRSPPRHDALTTTNRMTASA